MALGLICHAVVVIQCRPRFWLEEMQSEHITAAQKHTPVTAGVDKAVCAKNPTALYVTNVDANQDNPGQASIAERLDLPWVLLGEYLWCRGAW